MRVIGWLQACLPCGEGVDCRPGQAHAAQQLIRSLIRTALHDMREHTTSEYEICMRCLFRYTLQDMREYGRKKSWCPYYLARHMLAFANVIVYNYQYMLDPKVIIS